METVKAHVKQGVIVGEKFSSPNGTVFHSFKGIPYAVPPIGELRFKSPLPLERFDEPELDCTKERDVSHQRDYMTRQVMGSENCLFLNVYAPQSTRNNGPLPVMVFIHGGGFNFGSGNSDMYYPLRFMEEEVIVVTLNYRVGALGFLCLPEAGIWGNAGLKDQRLALEWIQQNISQFNGDPKNVTLFGESAGGASVHLHVYAEHAHKLFHKAIMHSGTANMEWVFQINPIYKAHRLAELLGCTSSDDREILAYLQSEKITPDDILGKMYKVFSPEEMNFNTLLPFKPVIEDKASPDKFISRPINEMLTTPNILKMPTIIGYNSGEGLFMTGEKKRDLSAIQKQIEHLVPRNIPITSEAETKNLAMKIRDFYFKNKQIDEKSLDDLSDLLGDYHFIFDAHKAIEWQLKFQPEAPLYVYRFDYVGGRNFFKTALQVEDLRGACHVDELFYLFQSPTGDATQAEDDEICTKRLCALWANFGRHGKPTVEPKNDVINFEWQPVRKPSNTNDNTLDIDYLSIEKKCEMLKNPDAERINFWRNIYSTYNATDYSRASAKL